MNIYKNDKIKIVNENDKLILIFIILIDDKINKIKFKMLNQNVYKLNQNVYKLYMIYKYKNNYVVIIF